VRIFVGLALATALTMNAQDRSYARSPVITTRGIAATSQTLASQAAAQALARGGSAVDAAIVANTVLAVVEPMNCGMGGDLFALYWDARTGKLTGINASGLAPKGLTIAWLKAHEFSSMPATGIHTVSVPGAVAGWYSMQQRFGKLPWRELFQPAIYYARNGFPVTDIIQADWESHETKLRADGNARRVYLIDGRAPRVGEIFRNPELAHAFELLASGGPGAFYKGPIADAVLATSRRFGGTMVAEDLASYRPEWVDPISTDYRGWRVYQLPPNGQGIGTLEMLAVMREFDIPEFGPLSPEAFHLKIEAQKLSFQDLRAYVADPRFVEVPTAAMSSKSYGADRAALISRDKANCATASGDPRHHGDTVYLAVVDADGNIASWIQSLSDAFGSGIVVDGMGFHLHDRASAFTMDEKHPNALAPGKRPFHTIIPGFMEKGDLRIGFGIMRGLNQPQAQAQFVSYVVDHKMNIQAALEAPRFTKITAGGCDLRIESRVPVETRDALTRMGHVLTVVGDYSNWMGGGQAVMRDARNKVNYGASSPRKDGAAAPEPDPYFVHSPLATRHSSLQRATEVAK
jgi:gamma-glutamyltranspeptidase/glutathione hydrolase